VGNPSLILVKETAQNSRATLRVLSTSLMCSLMRPLRHHFVAKLSICKWIKLLKSVSTVLVSTLSTTPASWLRKSFYLAL